MTTYTQAEIAAQLQSISNRVISTASAIAEDRFFDGTPTAWSPADYLKHLLLTVKMFAKALRLREDPRMRIFTPSDRPSESYEQLVARYTAVIDQGFGAEDNPPILPSNYRVPEDVSDVKSYLIETWKDANDRMIATLNTWTEADLDGLSIPHPAVGMITVREMLYFTIYHNQLHGNDIARAGVAVG